MKEEEKKLVSNTIGQARMNLANKMNPYQSQWQTQLDDTMQKIMNREKFSYDLNGDALWKTYKDQYQTGGKMAMMDTMGQAAALTGGYGNSYAQGVGQQSYQGYMQGLNDKIPELYQMALDSYNREGDELLQQYSLMADRESTDYGRYIDDRNFQYQLDKDQADLDAQEQADQRAMALAMLEAGIRPSDEMLAAAGLNMEYVNAMYSEGGAVGANGYTFPGVATSSDWFKNNMSGDGWLTTAEGQNWMNYSEQGKNWAAKNPYDAFIAELDALHNAGKIEDGDYETAKKKAAEEYGK